jgi:hypothetical protein
MLRVGMPPGTLRVLLRHPPGDAEELRTNTLYTLIRIIVLISVCRRHAGFSIEQIARLEPFSVIGRRGKGRRPLSRRSRRFLTLLAEHHLAAAKEPYEPEAPVLMLRCSQAALSAQSASERAAPGKKTLASAASCSQR